MFQCGKAHSVESVDVEVSVPCRPLLSLFRLMDRRGLSLYRMFGFACLYRQHKTFGCVQCNTRRSDIYTTDNPSRMAEATLYVVKSIGPIPESVFMTRRKIQCKRATHHPRTIVFNGCVCVPIAEHKTFVCVHTCLSDTIRSHAYTRRPCV
jgi:hypothetical protein